MYLAMMFCDHANECPIQLKCLCPVDCACRESGKGACFTEKVMKDTCKSCGKVLSKKRFPVWDTPSGHAYVCSRKCLDEIGGTEYTVKPKRKKIKRVRFEGEDE